MNNGIARIDLQTGEVVEGEVVDRKIEPVMTIEGSVRQYEFLKSVVSSVMRPNFHYGRVPGTQGLTLYKPGSELLCSIYGLSVRVKKIDREVEWDSQFASYTVTVELVSNRTGQVVGEGLGCCNSLERKYSRPLTEKKTHLGDLMNTLLKMAKKRALSDAVLGVTGATGIFTQTDDDLDQNQRQQGQQQGRQGSRPQVRPATKMTIDQAHEIERLARLQWGDGWRQALDDWMRTPFDRFTADDAMFVLDDFRSNPPAAAEPAPQAPPVAAGDVDPFGDE